MVTKTRMEVRVTTKITINKGLKDQPKIRLEIRLNQLMEQFLLVVNLRQ